MNLIIDIGNSGTKLALYNAKKMIGTARHKSVSGKMLKGFVANHKIRNIIVSSVNESPDSIAEFAAEISARFIVLSHKTKLPFKIRYTTPETLGTDRIAAVAGAYKYFRDQTVLIIDAGTAITYDLLDRDIYEGGNISPGIDIRFKALNKFTSRLPFLKRSNIFTSPAKSTKEAIVAGVIIGITYEINEYIRTFEKKYKELKVIITGGDGLFLKERVDRRCIFLPDIVTDGLNFILDYNA